MLHLVIHIKTLHLKYFVIRNRYREDIIKPGQVGGHCQLDVNILKSQGEHKSPLQSW